jgi:hypothetical protein
MIARRGGRGTTAAAIAPAARRAVGRVAALVAAGRGRAGRVDAEADPAGAVPEAAVARAARVGRAVGDRADRGGVRPAAGDRAEGRPTGKTVGGSDSEAGTVPNATSTTGTAIEDAVGPPAADRGRGSATTGRDRAGNDRGNRAVAGRLTEATTGRGGLRGPQSAIARGDSRAAPREAASIADSNRARIVRSIGRDPPAREAPPVAGREARSVPGHASGADTPRATRRAPTAGRRLARIRGSTGLDRGRTERRSRPDASRAPISPACSVRTRSWLPAGGRSRRHSSPDGTPIG